MLLLVVTACSLLNLVACCCFLLACLVSVAPAWPRGLLPCTAMWVVVVPCSPALCSVFCGAVLPCGAVLSRAVVRFCLLVCAVPCCAARRDVRCRFCLRCPWCLVLWCVAVCCGASLGVLLCGGAAVVRRGVLLCRAVFCGAVSPCGAVLLGCAVRFAVLRVFVFPLKTILQFLKIKIRYNKIKQNYTLPNSRTQAGSNTKVILLMYVWRCVVGEGVLVCKGLTAFPPGLVA